MGRRATAMTIRAALLLLAIIAVIVLAFGVWE
jgi:hypothetical protein